MKAVMNLLYECEFQLSYDEVQVLLSIVYQ